MSLFVIQEKVSEDLENSKDFFNGDESFKEKKTNKNTDLVKWLIAYNKKQKGELHNRDLSILNKASWQVGLEIYFKEQVPLEQVIIRKFEKERGLSSWVLSGGFGVGSWKTIKRDWGGIITRTSFVLGNDRRVKL